MSEPSDITAPEGDSPALSDSQCLDQRCIGKRLRGCAFRATDTLTSASPARLREIVERLLRCQAHAMDAIDVHLFRVRLDDAGTGIAGLRYHSGQAASDDDLAALKHFQFQLFSAEVQECLRADRIVQVRAGSTSGGRLITGLMKQLDCSTYILCPLFVAQRFRGIIAFEMGKPARKTMSSLNC